KRFSSRTRLPCSSWVTSPGPSEPNNKSSLWYLCPRSVKKRMLFAEVAPRSSTHKASCDDSVRETSPMPLERRVSFCAGALLVVSAGPADDPRKNLIRLIATGAVHSSRRHL